MGASTAWEIVDSAGRHLRFAEGGRDDADTKAYRSAARELLHRAVDRPDIYLSTVRCMLSRTKAKVTHLALLKHLRRCRLGFERIRSTLSGFSTALLWDGTSGNEHLHKASDSFQQWRVAVLPRTSDSPCALSVRELLLQTNFKMDTEVVTVCLAARGMVQQTVSGRLKCLEESWLWLVAGTNLCKGPACRDTRRHASTPPTWVPSFTLDGDSTSGLAHDSPHGSTSLCVASKMHH